MGNKESAVANEESPDGPLSPEQMREFTEKTVFTPQDIQRLLLVYRKISGSTGQGGDGKIDIKEFLTHIKFINEEIGTLIYKMIDTNGDHKIDFAEFVEGLNIFCNGSDLKMKIRKCFEMYDNDHSQSIEKKEIKDIINMSRINNKFIDMDDAHLEELVYELLQEFDSSRSGNKLTLNDFTKMVTKAPGILDAFEFDMSMLPTPEELKQ